MERSHWPCAHSQATECENPRLCFLTGRRICSRHSNWMAEGAIWEVFQHSPMHWLHTCTNAYQFKLITCIVPDDFGKGMWSVGYCKTALHIIKLSHLDVHTKKHESSISHVGQPIARCITNYETTAVLELFLGRIKAGAPSSSVSVLMTDDGK